MRIPVFSQKSNRWREFYNPLRGLSLPKLVGLLEAGERGQYADLQWFYHFIDRQITITATGGLLTMLSESGSGTLAGGAHSETFMQIARGDAAILSGVLQEQFDVPLLAQYFPDQPVLAYFEFAPPASEESSRAVEDAVALAGAGIRVDPEELSERTGYQLAGGGEL